MSQRTDLTAVSNQMILSRSNFSVPQRRVIAAILQTVSYHIKDELSRHDKENGNYLKSVSRGLELSYQLGVFDTVGVIYKASDLSLPEHYDELRKALMELTDKSIFFETEEEEVYTKVLLKFHFEKRSENIKMVIDELLYKLLLDLTKGYTLYQTKVVLSFSSSYAMRMYEIIAKWRGKPQFELSVTELRRLTDTIDKYPQIFDLKKRVLDYAKNELDRSEVTDLRFSYKDKKKSREIVAFIITIHKTDSAHEEKQKANKAVSLYWDFSKSVIDNFKKYDLILKGKNLDLVKALVNAVGEQKLSLEMDMIFEKAKDTPNPQAYMIKSLKNYLHNATKESVSLTVDERKKHAENVRKGDTEGSPKSFGDLLKNLTE